MMARREKHRRSQRAEPHNYRARRSDRQETIQRFLIVCEGEKTEPSYLVTVRKQRSGLVEIQDIDVGAII